MRWAIRIAMWVLWFEAMWALTNVVRVIVAAEPLTRKQFLDSLWRYRRILR